MRLPTPLKLGKLCSDCQGTGANKSKLLDDGYARCWACNGNGLDPAEYFRWDENYAQTVRNGTGQ